MKYPVRIWREFQTSTWLNVKKYYDTSNSLIWFGTELIKHS